MIKFTSLKRTVNCKIIVFYSSVLWSDLDPQVLVGHWIPAKWSVSVSVKHAAYKIPYSGRDLEREVNLGWTDIIPQSEADGHLLALMLYRWGCLFLCSSVMEPQPSSFGAAPAPEIFFPAPAPEDNFCLKLNLKKTCNTCTVLWIRIRIDPELLPGSGIIVPDQAEHERADG